MSIVVDHEERRQRILETALELFAEQGYPAVTYRKIAERCGLARTALYRYFGNKREIFDFAINRLTTDLGRQFTAVALDNTLSACQRIEQIGDRAISALCEQRSLLTVIVEYLLHQQRAGEKVSKKVRQHTDRLRVLLRKLFREGVRTREFHHVAPRCAAELLYSLLEANVLKLAVTDTADPLRMKQCFSAATQALARPDSGP